MKKRPLLGNVLLMLGYSVLFILLNGMFGDVFIGFHWAAVLIHMVLALVLGLVYLSNDETRARGGQFLLAALLVAIIGHGLCFFNGLVNMGPIH